MSRYLRIYRDFSGGLSEAANDNIADHQLVEARNIMPGDGYGLARACGTGIAYPRIPVSQPSLNRISRLIELKPTSGSSQLLAAVSVPVGYEDVYRYDAATGAWTLLTVGHTAEIKDWFIQAGKLYWLNGSKMMVYDGTSVGEAALVPAGGSATEAELAVWGKVKKAVAVEQRGQRWFYATPDNEIIFSEIGLPTKFDPTSIININTKNGDSITALHEFNDGLLVFKKHSAHYLVGWDFAGGSDVQLLQLNVSSGTVFPKSIATVDNGVIYLGLNGLYRLSIPAYSSVVAAENISEGKISRRLYQEVTISDACAAVWDNTYYLSVRKQVPLIVDGEPAGDVEVNYEYRYLLAGKSFFGEFTQGASAYALGLGGETALFIGCANGYVLRYDRDSYHYIDLLSGEPAAIESKARTKCYDIAGSMAQEVRLMRLEIASRQYLAEDSGFRLQIKADYGEQAWDSELIWNVDSDESLVYGEGLLGSGVWGWQDTVTQEMTVQRRCKRLQFIISSAIVDQPLLIYGLAVLYRKKRVKGSRRNVLAALPEQQ